MKDREGIVQREHFVDLFKEIELLYDNIKENTDSAFEMLKMVENNKDQESIDVLRIICSNILDCETSVEKFIKNYELIKEKVLNLSEIDIEKIQLEIIDLHKSIKSLEKESSKYFKQLLKLLYDIKK